MCAISDGPWWHHGGSRKVVFVPTPGHLMPGVNTGLICVLVSGDLLNLMNPKVSALCENEPLGWLGSSVIWWRFYSGCVISSSVTASINKEHWVISVLSNHLSESESDLVARNVQAYWEFHSSVCVSDTWRETDIRHHHGQDLWFKTAAATGKIILMWNPHDQC